MATQWSDDIDEILAGDQVVMLGSVTPFGGVVLGPVTNFATRDRHAGTVTVNSSVGARKKLERMARNPKVALAFHTRTHSLTDRPEYVLIQGTASLSQPIEDYPGTIPESWERFAGPREGRLWRRWLQVYYRRVSIDVAVHRIVVWPELPASGQPQVTGAPLPDRKVPSQRPPGRGTGPRLDRERVVRVAVRSPHVLFGWVDADGFPFIVPVEASPDDDDGKGDNTGNGDNTKGGNRGGNGSGVRIRTSGPLLPTGERRAGLTAHAFGRHVIGQHQRVFTGWLRTDHQDRTRGSYAPHTSFGYRMPPSKLFYRVAVGAATRWGLRRTRPPR